MLLIWQHNSDQLKTVHANLRMDSKEKLHNICFLDMICKSLTIQGNSSPPSSWRRKIEKRMWIYMYEKEYIIFYTRRKRMNTKISAIHHSVCDYSFHLWLILTCSKASILWIKATRWLVDPMKHRERELPKHVVDSLHIEILFYWKPVLSSRTVRLMKPAKRIYMPGFLKQDNTKYVKRYKKDIIIWNMKTEWFG